MIIVYPMLVSNSVTQNVIPGIAKVLENYIIVKLQDDVISHPDMKRRYAFKIKGKKIIAKENENLTEAYTKGGPSTGSKRDSENQDDNKKQDRMKRAEHALKQKEKAMSIAKKKQEITSKKKEEEASEKTKKAKNASASVDVKDIKTLSVEPTYITVEVKDRHDNIRKEFIGVKVVGFRVKSDEKLSRLIMHDTQLSNLNASMVTIGRKTMRYFYRIFDYWAKKLKISDTTPSGDPRRDILFRRTGYGDHGGFIVLNKNEDVDEYFLSNIQKVNRLFNMGWGNIIVVDDVNRIAYFCLKKFKGTCMQLNYAMLYNSLGLANVYNDLEDAKKQSSSIFKIKSKWSKVVSEWITTYRYEKYIKEDK